MTKNTLLGGALALGAALLTPPTRLAAQIYPVHSGSVQERQVIKTTGQNGVVVFHPVQERQVVEPGFKSLFNGKDLTGWAGRTNHWSVEDGAIAGVTSKDNPAKGNNFIIAKDGDKNLVVDDFELRFSYKFSSDWGNSGLQYRSKDFGNFVVGGYQADFEVGPTFSGILYEERMSRGIMAQRGEKVVWGADGKKKVVGKTDKTSAEIQAAIQKNGWNDYVIIAKGSHLQHFINGIQTVDVIDEDPTKQVSSGILAFQIHQGDPMKIQFKNIRIKPLK
jgi:predicted RNA binding protein YcfA (HicA-like mRNA interferase family)